MNFSVATCFKMIHVYINLIGLRLVAENLRITHYCDKIKRVYWKQLMSIIDFYDSVVLKRTGMAPKRVD